jgi:hypothetical protein
MKRKRTGTTYHLCIPVERALDELIKGNNLLDCTPSQSLKILTKYRNLGKEYFTGCSKEDETGRCKGHPIYDGDLSNN